ncbi:hypothetical protein JK191_13190 [Gluconobacter sphaericus]|uniref:hypothetical protein n=1 Tax=Gluconobacter sphaericus TaxID=574987 RepID=UPI001B8C4304|nr:hypothetical protein [Gluconobacter sphaericus]MBS1098487.1 hypothetical protein [Gluconobacter sphaericus]
MNKFILTLIVAFLPRSVMAFPTNSTSGWKSAEDTGNSVGQIKSPTITAPLVLKVNPRNIQLLTPKIYAGTINGVLQVADQATMANLSISSISRYTSAHRYGYYTAGDGGQASYTLSATPCTLNNGAGDNGSQIPAPVNRCWIASFPNNEASAKAWGAKFNSTDDSVPLQAAINWAVANSGSMVLPCGYSYFSTPLKAGNGTNWTMRGTDNATCSTLVYSGTSTTVDLLTIGTVGTSGDSYGVTITGFRLDTNTQMTSGDGLHLWHLKQSRVDPTLSGQSGNGKFWNGVHYDEVDIVRTPNAYIYGAANDNVLVNGSKQSETWYPNYVGEVRLGQGKIAPSDPQLNRGGKGQYSQTGIHVAGSVGGFSTDAVDIIANHHNIVVDNSQTGVQNQTVLLGPGTFTDSSINDNIVLNDTGSTAVPGFGGTKRFFDYGWNACGGCASGSGNGITIQNFTNGAVVLAGYAIQGHQGHGVYDMDPSTVVMISSSEVFGNNAKENIASSSSGMKIASQNPIILNGTAYDANTLSSKLPLYGGPFYFTPELRFGGQETGLTYSVQSGQYTLDGMTVNIDFNIVLSAVGSATGSATITNLPIGQNSSTAQGGGGTVNYATGLKGLNGSIALSIDNGGSRLAGLYQWGATGLSAVTDANFTDSSVIRGRLSFSRTHKQSP